MTGLKKTVLVFLTIAFFLVFSFFVFGFGQVKSDSLFNGPLRISPQNSRYFSDQTGKIIFLAGSHTWRDFQNIGSDNPDYATYLNFLRNYNLNFMRLWIWEQSRGTAGYPPTAVVSPLPYQRTGPGLANDGELKFNLNSFNQEFFDRLRQRIIDAGNQGIYVSIELFNGFSVGKGVEENNPWPSHPFNVNNNINEINGDPNKDGYGYETQTLAIPEITAIQDAYVKKVIDTVNDLDNVLYEICNESEGNQASVDWQNHMINLIKTYEATKPKQHPVGFSVPYPNGDNSWLFASQADFISPNEFDSDGYNYKTNPRPSTGSKVIISDTDHLWGLGGDRYWVWKSFTRGLGTSYMDCYVEDAFGCPISQSDPDRLSLLANLGYLRSYAEKINLAIMVPTPTTSSTGYALAKAGSEYLVYQPNSGSFTVNLAAGNYNYEWFRPSTGTIAQTGKITSTGGNKSFTPPFSGDAVLYLKIISSTPTPIPTLTPTPVPIISPTPTASVTPTPTSLPTLSPTPTSTPRLSPTPTPIPTRTPTPTPTPTPTLTPTPIPTMSPTPTPTPSNGRLVAAYNFNEGSGTVIYDRSGNGNNGTVSSPLWTTSGKYGKALTFGTFDRRVVVPDSDLLDLTTGMTVEAWVYPTSKILDSWRTIVLKEAPGLYSYGLYTYKNNNYPYGYISDNGVEYGAGVNSSLSLNTWTHLAVTYDGSVLRLYKNGVQIASRSHSGSIATSEGALSIGANSVWTNELFYGRIDEVRIYSRSLSSNEILLDMNTPIN